MSAGHPFPNLHARPQSNAPAGSSGGVLTNLSDTVVAVIIPEGAHHLDLMSVVVPFAQLKSVNAAFGEKPHVAAVMSAGCLSASTHPTTAGFLTLWILLRSRRHVASRRRGFVGGWRKHASLSASIAWGGAVATPSTMLEGQRVGSVVRWRKGSDHIRRPRIAMNVSQGRVTRTCHKGVAGPLRGL